MLRASLIGATAGLLLLSGFNVADAMKPATGIATGSTETKAETSGASMAMRRELRPFPDARGSRPQVSGDIVTMSHPDGSVQLIMTSETPVSQEEIEACRRHRHMLAARLKAQKESGVTAVLLDSKNISEETKEAEADPCKFLNDKLNNVMAGHVKVPAARVEVPDHTTPGPMTEEENKVRAATYIFLGTCGVVGVCMIFMFLVTLCLSYNNKKKKREAAKQKAAEDLGLAPSTAQGATDAEAAKTPLVEAAAPTGGDAAPTAAAAPAAPTAADADDAP